LQQQIEGVIETQIEPDFEEISDEEETPDSLA
jgi:hypothetical protein